MKKILLLFAVLATSLCIFFASCDSNADSSSSYDSGDYTYYGNYSTQGDCINALANAGYSRYKYYSDGSCYGGR